MNEMTSEQLLSSAREAKKAMDKAETKAEVAVIFDSFKGTLGYKVTVRLLLGSSPEDATSKWRAKIGE